MDNIDSLVDQLDGTPEAKRRLKVVLRSTTGLISDAEACRALAVSLEELKQMRRDAMGGMWGAIIPMPPPPSLN